MNNEERWEAVNAGDNVVGNVYYVRVADSGSIVARCWDPATAVLIASAPEMAAEIAELRTLLRKAEEWRSAQEQGEAARMENKPPDPVANATHAHGMARIESLETALRETRSVLMSAVHDSRDDGYQEVSGMLPSAWWNSRVGTAIERIDAVVGALPKTGER